MAVSNVGFMQEGFVRVSMVRGGRNSSIIRPKLPYHKDYVDMARVFNRKLVFEVWNVSNFLGARGGSKLPPFP